MTAAARPPPPSPQCATVSRLFWLPAGLLAYAQAGYPLLLAALSRGRGRPQAPQAPGAAALPDVSFIVAAYNEADVIAAKVADAFALDYPRERLEVIVSVDGATDDTAERARAAGADVVLENPRAGKVRAQDAAVREARGAILAFSDANARWEPGALRALVTAFADPQVGYACGRVTFVAPDGATNEEGLYWRYEMWLRGMESGLSSVTAGNGAIYATRRDSYLEVDPIMGHDLSFPFNMVKRGWRAVDVPEARATEKMVPTVEGEFARKRRMMSHGWPIVLLGGLADPRGYPPPYALMILSHRLLRYGAPFLHVVALLSARRWALGANLAVLGAAAAGGRAGRAGVVARYYVLTQASVALGLWDWVRHGTEAGWEAAEGTR